jgi:RNA polymerase sigma factor for flagellar operon FliA
MNNGGPKNGYGAGMASGTSGPAGWGRLTPAQRSEYIEKYSPLIKYVADRLASRLPAHVAKDDLISAGILGLIDAVDKFDPNRNILFKTYAEFRVKGAMLDELRAMDWVPRGIRRKSTQVEKAYQNLEAELGRPAADEEVAASMNLALEDFMKLLDEVKSVSLVDIDVFHNAAQGQSRPDLLDLLADESRPDALASLGLTESKKVVAEAIGDLPEKERLVVAMYYYDELTMKEIGQVLGYTESRISQLHTKALIRLKNRLRRYFTEARA